jgi:hypothetical protein
MTETAHLQLGRLRPDGTRDVTVTDDRGLLLHGYADPEAAGQSRPGQSLTLNDVAGIVATAGRAPSVHNTQPWIFRTYGNVIELYADTGRMLRRIDPAGREMVISCGAALFGLRLGIRRLGYLPERELLPDTARPALIARIWPAGTARITRQESDLLAALPHRHTHRGPFSPGDVSARLLAGLQADALAEQAELVLIEQPAQVGMLVELVRAAAIEQAASAETVAEVRGWVRPAGSAARDGIPAHARVQIARHGAGGDDPAAAGDHVRLPQRDFCLSGTEASAGYPPSVTAVLTTPADTAADWVQAGQALHRVLLHAATRWVFASLQSQPMESPALRAALRAQLGLAGEPQLLLQFGRCNTAAATPRRPVADTLTDQEPADG